MSIRKTYSKTDNISIWDDWDILVMMVCAGRFSVQNGVAYVMCGVKSSFDIFSDMPCIADENLRSMIVRY